MILRSLKLDNIRSYASEEISFPEGSVLLSGDIGSGKSTILLAIDFALFGLQKDLTGASLLKHGKEQGSVELSFELSGKPFTIRRTLKRKKESVRQAAGYITIDGIQKDLTAQESKSFILSLLGYPPEAIKKDSALLYRYTVYTPQEQMKQIIESGLGDRIDLMRRLFNMDRYKRIAENAEMYARELRGRARELAGTISDLDDKKREKKELTESSAEEKKKLDDVAKRLSALKASLTESKKALEQLGDEIESLGLKKQEYASLKAEFELLKASGEKLKAAFNDISPRLMDLEKRLDAFKTLEKPLSKADIESEISRLEKSERLSLSKIASLETEASSLARILEKGVCGTCGQSVADREAFAKGIESKRKEIELLNKSSGGARECIEKLRKDLEIVRKYESDIRERKSLEERIKELSESKNKIKSEISENIAKQKSLASRINLIAGDIKKSTPLADRYKQAQNSYETLRTDAETLAREESSLAAKLSGIKEAEERLSMEIKRKTDAKARMEKFIRFDQWLRDFFVSLMGTIERHAMASVQQDFNSLFQKWFSMLVMDEGLSARIDGNFSIIIEQEGFETDYSFLSGGERTAIALAYRLALNRVINDLTESIKTKDLIILDEPTDGFSSDQMDSVREVLSELASRQTIIVSHEPKVESFVSNTIRIVKDAGTSKILE
jgi:DNA repair protein SbcC/Rad50